MVALVGLNKIKLYYKSPKNPKNKEVFWIGHIEPSKLGLFLVRTRRALKARRCSVSDWESPKNEEVFRIRLGQPLKKLVFRISRA